MAELLACGIPVITNSGIGDSDMIISQQKGGIIIEDFSSLSYQKALASLDDFLKLPPEYYRNIAQSLFSLDMGVAAYEEIYNSLLTLSV